MLVEFYTCWEEEEKMLQEGECEGNPLNLVFHGENNCHCEECREYSINLLRFRKNFSTKWACVTYRRPCLYTERVKLMGADSKRNYILGCKYILLADTTFFHLPITTY